MSKRSKPKPAAKTLRRKARARAERRKKRRADRPYRQSAPLPDYLPDLPPMRGDLPILPSDLLTMPPENFHYLFDHQVAAAIAALTLAGGKSRRRHRPTGETIQIDGIDCCIEWTETEDDAYWAVIRHGCEIGKGLSRDSAIADARRSLAESAWLRLPKQGA